jgi:uncharacterized protein
MVATDPAPADSSEPFHEGELAIQDRLGIRDKMDKFGRVGIRAFMPEQHREFFARLPFFVVGSVDRGGRAWASVLSGPPGFLSSPDPRHLHVRSAPQGGDPLREVLELGAPLGGLGLEFHTRRRNRINGTVCALSAETFTLKVVQSFGNCPRYIQAREYSPAVSEPRPGAAVSIDSLTDDARALIHDADTLFIASSYVRHGAARNEGVDVSHRGGRPGFARVDDTRTIVIPDFHGNFFFNTLGNLLVNPRCGLTFIDFRTGDLLQLTGSAEVIWKPDPAGPEHAGALRLVRFQLDAGVLRPAAISGRWTYLSTSPQLEAN